MNTSIMLGNGLNRCIVDNISWSNLLLDIANEFHVTVNGEISFPMQFEVLANQILNSPQYQGEDIYLCLKKNIITKLQSMVVPKELPHSEFAKLSNTLLTTNYDYLIEKSLDADFCIKDITKCPKDNNNRYNLRNLTRVSGTNVYHVHGDITSAKSICLGYEHYAGTLQHLRSSMTTIKQNNPNKTPEIVRTLTDDKYVIDIWAEKFFTDDVHIVGLGLTQSEIDIWWLLTYRASLYYSNRYNCRNLIANQIVYHDVGIAEDVKMRAILKNMAVEYKFHMIHHNENKYYLQEYMNIAKSIAESTRK